MNIQNISVYSHFFLDFCCWKIEKNYFPFFLKKKFIEISFAQKFVQDILLNFKSTFKKKFLLIEFMKMSMNEISQNETYF